MHIRKTIHRIIRSFKPRVRQQRKHEQEAADKIAEYVLDGRKDLAAAVVQKYLAEQAARDGISGHPGNADCSNGQAAVQRVTAYARTAGVNPGPRMP